MAEPWPFPTLRPADVGWSLTGGSVDAGRSLAGSSGERVQFGGGPLWVARLNRIALRSREQRNLWRAMEARMQNGAVTVDVPMCGALDGPSTAAAPVTASQLLGDAEFRATTALFNVMGGRLLAGGEHFSIEHPTAGWRLYRIASIVSVETVTGGREYECEVYPPIREDADAGTTLEWDTPRCEMSLDDPDGMAVEFEQWKRASPSLTFIEDLRVLEAFAA